MQIERVAFGGVTLFQNRIFEDERGSFERMWSAEEIVAAGFSQAISQVSIARNHLRGTIRGLHYSAAPHAEVKCMRCLQGAIFDVIVDIRPGSATFGRYESFELAAGDGRTLCIPAGYAHGYQTLTDNTEIVYLIDKPYVADAARTIRYNDAAIAVDWPLPVACIADRDATAPSLTGSELESVQY